jgi:hypothetical protein
MGHYSAAFWFFRGTSQLHINPRRHASPRVWLEVTCRPAPVSNAMHISYCLPPGQRAYVAMIPWSGRQAWTWDRSIKRTVSVRDGIIHNFTMACSVWLCSFTYTRCAWRFLTPPLLNVVWWHVYMECWSCDNIFDVERIYTFRNENQKNHQLIYSHRPMKYVLT